MPLRNFIRRCSLRLREFGAGGQIAVLVILNVAFLLVFTGRRLTQETLSSNSENWLGPNTRSPVHLPEWGDSIKPTTLMSLSGEAIAIPDSTDFTLVIVGIASSGLEEWQSVLALESTFPGRIRVLFLTIPSDPDRALHMSTRAVGTTEDNQFQVLEEDVEVALQLSCDCGAVLLLDRSGTVKLATSVLPSIDVLVQILEDNLSADPHEGH